MSYCLFRVLVERLNAAARRSAERVGSMMAQPETSQTEGLWCLFCHHRSGDSSSRN